MLTYSEYSPINYLYIIYTTINSILQHYLSSKSLPISLKYFLPKGQSLLVCILCASQYIHILLKRQKFVGMTEVIVNLGIEVALPTYE